jgi:erythromycin esterase-like protein
MKLANTHVNYYHKIFYGLLVVFITALFFTPVEAQKLIKDYVIKNSVTLKTISPDSTDDSDLKPIADAIGNAKIVMLGEQDHGDAPTFLAKTRLVKYLHEKKGFNVLAFESDFFALNYGWDRIAKKSPIIDSFILKNIYSVWTTCDACNSLLFKYIPSTYITASPLTVTGFDSQQYLNFSYYNMPRMLDSTMRAMQLPITREPNYTSEILPCIDSISRWTFFNPKDTVGLQKSIVYLLNIRDELAGKVNQNDFWLYVLDNEIGLVTEIKETIKAGRIVDKGRDTRMAANLEWLMNNKFKDQKIIVWAADIHIARNIKISKYYPQMAETMGGKFMEHIADPGLVYTIGFTSYEGMAGRVGSPGYAVKNKIRNSFETWFTAKQPYAFVDFKAFNKLNPGYSENFYASPISHFVGLGQWNQVFDGLFYIRDMYRCIPTRTMKILSFFGP